MGSERARRYSVQGSMRADLPRQSHRTSPLEAAEDDDAGHGSTERPVHRLVSVVVPAGFQELLGAEPSGSGSRARARPARAGPYERASPGTYRRPGSVRDGDESALRRA